MYRAVSRLSRGSRAWVYRGQRVVCRYVRVVWLRRIIGGDRDGSLLQGPDPISVAIVGQVLTRLAQPPGMPAQEDP